jgi:hypothetical protein
MRISLMMKYREIQPGEKFERWTIIARIGDYRGGHTRYEAVCKCGEKGTPRADALLTGTSLSCGCIAAESLKARALTHGMSGSKSPEYQAWAHMIRRCHTPSTKGYESYGGRGITVCDRWRNSFENFIADMGMRPSSQHSLDRINNDGNYEPGNCRWATPVEQSNNTRQVHGVTYQGRTQSIAAWERELGMARNLLRGRIAAGWSVTEAIETKPGSVRHESQRNRTDEASRDEGDDFTNY